MTEHLTARTTEQTTQRQGQGQHSRDAWTRWQGASGVVVATFVTFHLLNTFLLGVSFEAYNGVQAVLRLVYQNPLFEGVLMLAIVIHMVCGVRGMVVRRRRRTSGSEGSGTVRVPVRVLWQRRAGWFLLAFVTGHVVATRGASLWFDVFPGAEGLSFTMAYLPGYFYPYYFLLGLAGLYHGATGIDVVLARRHLRVRVGPFLRPLTVFGGLLLIAALLGAGGVLYPVPDPFANDYAALVLRLMGGTR